LWVERQLQAEQQQVFATCHWGVQTSTQVFFFTYKSRSKSFFLAAILGTYRLLFTGMGVHLVDASTQPVVSLFGVQKTRLLVYLSASS
jgi:hypothetical protein